MAAKKRTKSKAVKTAKKKTGFIEGCRDYAKSSFSKFLDSFRSLDRNYLYVVVYDLAFLIIMYIAMIKFKEHINIFMQKAMPFVSSAAGVMAGAPNISPETAAKVNSIVAELLGIIAIYALIGIVVYIAFSALVWRQISRKKFSTEFFWKFGVMGLIWIAAWIVFSVIIANGIRLDRAMWWLAAFLIIFLHLSTVANIAFTKYLKIFKPMRKAFSVGFGKIQKFIAPYIYGLGAYMVVYYVMYFIVYIIQKTVGSRALAEGAGFYSNLFLFIQVVGYVLYFAWLKIYIYSFAKDIV